MLTRKNTSYATEVTRSSDRRKPRVEKVKPLGPIKRYAVWLLSRQDYAAADLERRFKLKGYPATEPLSLKYFAFLKKNNLY